MENSSARENENIASFSASAKQLNNRHLREFTFPHFAIPNKRTDWIWYLLAEFSNSNLATKNHHYLLICQNGPMIMNYCFQESFSKIQPKLTKSYSSSRASWPDHPNNHSSARKDKINLLIPDQERPLGPRTRLHNPTKSMRGCIVQGSKDPTQELIKQRQGSARSSSLQLLKSEH